MTMIYQGDTSNQMEQHMTTGHVGVVGLHSARPCTLRCHGSHNGAWGALHGLLRCRSFETAESERRARVTAMLLRSES
jgi:hypothetical protein